jgi:hypothetical protein
MESSSFLMSSHSLGGLGSESRGMAASFLRLLPPPSLLAKGSERPRRSEHSLRFQIQNAPTLTATTTRTPAVMMLATRAVLELCSGGGVALGAATVLAITTDLDSFPGGGADVVKLGRVGGGGTGTGAGEVEELGAAGGAGPNGAGGTEMGAGPAEGGGTEVGAGPVGVGFAGAGGTGVGAGLAGAGGTGVGLGGTAVAAPVGAPAVDTYSHLVSKSQSLSKSTWNTRIAASQSVLSGTVLAIIAQALSLLSDGHGGANKTLQM